MILSPFHIFYVTDLCVFANLRRGVHEDSVLLRPWVPPGDVMAGT